MQKTNFKTRLLALLTAAFMLVMCVPFAALADDPDVVVDLVWDTDQVEVTDGGSFDCDNGYASATVKAAGGAVTMPTVKGINGYEFKGWTNVGDKTELTLADATPYLEAGKTTLQLKAIAEKAPVVADTIVKVYVLVDTNTMKITDYGQFEMGDDGYATANFDKPGKELTLPTVVGINGYTFTGWDKVGTATSLTTEQAKALCADGKTTVVLNAQAKAPEATKFEYYIQNTDKNGHVDVLGDAQVQHLTFDNGTETLPLPYDKITANDGYKFDGWKISVQPVEGSAKEFTVPAGTQSFSIKEYGELTLVGASAIFSKVETPVTYFDYTIQNASKNGKVAVLGDAQIQTVSLPSTTTVLDLPYEKITANDGYVFAGWTIYVQPKTGDADKFVVAAGTKSVDVSKYGELAQAGASAIFNKVDNFTFTIQNASKNGKVEVLGNEQIQSVELPVTTKELPLPYEKITANDGYVFAGWTIYVQPKNGNADKFVVKAGTKSVDVSKYGELSLAGASAIFEEKTAETFTYAIQNASKNGKVEVLGDEQLQSVELPVGTKELPLPYEKITANDGYVFAGWTIYVQPKNGNADKFVVKAGTKSVDVSKYGDLALAGASAIFEKKTDDKKDNSTSSSSSSNNNTSSSSSSSNKTTTASNQKQVVKAAAAPANTTKVLPKTGASNVAPLLGGSLAVVALLMGYGVYSLVLRKKD